MGGQGRKIAVGVTLTALLAAGFPRVTAIRGTGELPGQQPPPGPPPRVFGAVPPPTSPSPVERLGENVFRVGTVRVDLAKKEVSVSGTTTGATSLEFIANTKGGYKSYESLIEADTNAIDLNVGLILIGLDRNHAVRPRFHFDPNPPQGDPVEIWVSWVDAGKTRRVRAEQLIYNEVLKQTLPERVWVYTGSYFLPKSTAYAADLDGVLIGFVHTPAPLIESSSPVPGPYSANQLNPSLNLKPGTQVTLTIHAISMSK